MSKTPIEPEDIRKGDLIRYEHTPPSRLRAVEYVAEADRYPWGTRGQNYLLDRPESKVWLPTEPGVYEVAGWTSTARLNAMGEWHDDYGNKLYFDPTDALRFTKLEPVPVTVKTFLASLRAALGLESPAWSPFVRKTIEDVLSRADDVAKSFGVLS